MVNTYSTIVTTEGAAIIAACLLNGEKLTITQAAAGDGGGAYYQPTVDQTELKGEKWRGEIASASANVSNPNMFDVKIVIDGDAGNFIVRELGLFDNSGNLIAVCNTPDMEKVAGGEGVSGKLVAVMHIVVADSSAVSFTINPSLGSVTTDELNEAIDAHDSADNPHPNKFAPTEHTHTASDIGADKSGAAAAAVSAHNSAATPHPGKFATLTHKHTASDVGAATMITGDFTTVATDWGENQGGVSWRQRWIFSGVLTTDVAVFADAVIPDDATMEDCAAIQEAWNCISRIQVYANGKIQFEAHEKKPAIDLTIRVVVVR